MGKIILELVNAYYKRNKETPKEVVVFANSCSNDQISIYNEFMVEPTNKKLE